MVGPQWGPDNGLSILRSDLADVVLADSGKFGHSAKYRVARLDEFDAIVTDEALPSEDVAAVKELGPRVVLG